MVTWIPSPEGMGTQVWPLDNHTQESCQVGRMPWPHQPVSHVPHGGLWGSALLPCQPEDGDIAAQGEQKHKDTWRPEHVS